MLGVSLGVGGWNVFGSVQNGWVVVEMWGCGEKTVAVNLRWP